MKDSRRPLPRDPFDPLDGTPDDSLNLHGFTVVEARTRVPAYLQQVRRRSPGALVHVITGKGNNSPGAPVLKQLVRSLLRAGLGDQVAAWDLDHDEGGYLIRLKR